MLRLPHALRPLFAEWLERHAPLRAKKVLNRIRSIRGGELNDARFVTRMRGEGPFADEIDALFEIAARKAGFRDGGPELSNAAFRRPTGDQLSLFG
jgi:DNA repair photolyase